MLSVAFYVPFLTSDIPWKSNHSFSKATVPSSSQCFSSSAEVNAFSAHPHAPGEQRSPHSLPLLQHQQHSFAFNYRVKDVIARVAGDAAHPHIITCLFLLTLLPLWVEASQHILLYSWSFGLQFSLFWTDWFGCCVWFWKLYLCWDSLKWQI